MKKPRIMKKRWPLQGGTQPYQGGSMLPMSCQQVTSYTSQHTGPFYPNTMPSTFYPKTVPAKLKPVKKAKEPKVEVYPPFIVERSWQDKKWIRLDDLASREYRRVWRNAKFISEDLFLTRHNHRHGTCMYHICGHFGKWIFYCRVPRGLDACLECDKPIDEAVLMLNKLQKLKYRGKG